MCTQRDQLSKTRNTDISKHGILLDKLQYISSVASLEERRKYGNRSKTLNAWQHVDFLDYFPLISELVLI